MGVPVPILLAGPTAVGTATFDAATFVRLARCAAREIQQRGKTPIFCGGTGLYFKAFLEGLDEAPAADAGLRAALEATPLAELLSELAQRDPAAFEQIDRQNPRRVNRAIAVIRLTGRPFSEQRAAWNRSGETSEGTAHAAFGLTRSPDDLRQRINDRVDEMFAWGLIEETRCLLEQGLQENPTARQAIGYRQVAAHLAGELPLAETIELVKRRTRQFARRQMRRGWILLEPGASPADMAGRIAASRWSRVG